MPNDIMLQNQYIYRILTKIEVDNRVSQRSLSRDLGIALGLANLLVRDLVHKGLVRVVRIKSNHVLYLLTPAGIAEKARMSRAAMQNSIQLYAEARDHIRERFITLSRELAINDGCPTGKRIVFYGTGEIAEIGYICLYGTDLQLVGVIDDQRKERFFEVPVYAPAMLHATDINGIPYGRLVVMSFGESDKIQAQLEALAIPPERVLWI